MNRSCVFEVVTLRLDEAVAQALVIAFLVVVRDKILNSRPQRTFTEQNEPFQAGFFDCAYKKLDSCSGGPIVDLVNSTRDPKHRFSQINKQFRTVRNSCRTGM